MLLALVLSVCAPAHQQPEADLVILGATVIDGTGAEPRTNTDVFIRDGSITAILAHGAAEPPAGATVMDADGAFVVPGLSDMHVHFSLGLPAPRRTGTWAAPVVPVGARLLAVALIRQRLVRRPDSP